MREQNARPEEEQKERKSKKYATLASHASMHVA